MAKKRWIAPNVRIVSIAEKGMCIGRDEEGRVYLVEFAVPGDVVDVEVRRKKKGLPFGAPARIVQPSPDRVEPKCRYFGGCGGCKWQNLRYEAQLQQKATMVKEALTRIGGVRNAVFDPIVPCPRVFYYRNKLEYSFSARRWLTRSEIESAPPNALRKDKALGFHAPGVFDKVVDVEHCYLQEEPSNAIKNFIRQYAFDHGLSFYNYRRHQGFLRSLIIRIATTGQVMVTLVFGEDHPDQIAALLSAVRQQFPQLTTLCYFINTKQNDSLFDLTPHIFDGPGYIIEQLDNIRYKIGPKSFFQTNSYQAVALYRSVVEMACINKTDTVYDLYTGVGGIALFVAPYARHVLGIETVEEAVRDARENAELNQCTNAAFRTGDVADVLHPEVWNRHGKPDVLITDPPRSGMHRRVIDHLIQLAPKRIVYVSCNPATQARDIALLSEYYHTVRVRPFDLFPHTAHVETIALLQRKDLSNAVH